jgi:hypothetical protein
MVMEGQVKQTYLTLNNGVQIPQMIPLCFIVFCLYYLV